MGISTYTINSELTDGMKVKVSDGRGHSIVIDEPENFGGSDEGMTPVEITLASLAGCLSITTVFLAKKMRIDVNSIEVEIEGDIDDKAMSSADVYSGFQEVRFKYKIDSDADKDKVEKLYKKIEDFCPVSDTLREKVELKGEYEIK